MRIVSLLLVVAFGCSSSRRAERSADTPQVPGDTALLATVSIAKLRASTAWPRLETAILSRLPIDKVKTKCGFDPLQTIETISLAAPAEFHPERMIVYARGVERGAVDACAKTLTAAQNHLVTIKDENKLVAYRESDKAMFAAWLDPRTIAVTPGDLGARDRLQLLVDKPQPTSAAFTEQSSKMASGHTLAFAFVAPPETDMLAFVAETGVEPMAGHGWLDLDSALRGEIALRFESAGRAATVVQDITKRIAADTSPMGSVLRGVHATANGSDVVIAVQLDQAATDQLISLLMSGTPN
ncbi:MAG TPA: hypothetical protein VIV40_30300 [Kofleriaceae bacterium]